MFRIWLRNLFPRTITKNRFRRRPQSPLRFLQLEDRTNPVVISISNPAPQFEGNAGTTTMTFTVTLDAASPGVVTVDFATADGTANAVIDYVATAGKLTFNAGDTSKTISVTINGDVLVEADETFSVILSNPSAGDTILAKTATGTILNDDAAAFKISKTANAVEGSPITFTVSLTNPVDVTTSVTVTTADGTATGGTDYTSLVSQLVTFPAGSVSQTVNVATTADTIVEADETFTATLGGLSNGGRGTVTISATDNVGTGTIVNDDQTTLTIANVAQLENVATMKFTVTSSNAVQGGFKVDFATAAGTAKNNIDYTFAAGTLTFAGTAGETQSFLVTIINDAIVEADETFTVQLSNVAPTNPLIATSAFVTTAIGTGTIQNDDSSAVTVANVSQSEAGGPMTFTVTLTNAVEAGFKLNYTITNGTTTNADYTVPGTFVTFVGNAGETQTFTVNPVNDNIVEPDETFKVALGPVTPTNVLIVASKIDATATAVGTILNDDSTILTIADVSQFEAAGPMKFTVVSSNPVQGGFKVDFKTADGTALIANNDYVSATGTLTFVGTANESQSFFVSVVDDNIVELDETFKVALSNAKPTDVTILSSNIVTTNTATGTIVNDDKAVLSISPATVTEGGNLVFNLTLSNPVDVAVTVEASTADLTTTGSRYTPLAGKLITFPALTTTATVAVFTVDDRIVQGAENLSVNLAKLAASGRAVSVNPTSAVGTILDNDFATFAYSAAAQSVSENNVTVSVNVVLTLVTVGVGPVALGKPAVVSVGNGGTTTLGPPVAGDYTFATPTVLTYAPATGASFVQPVSVAITEDLTDEGDETIVLPLTLTADGTGGQIALAAPSTHTITIVNDDNPVRTYDATVSGDYRIVRNGGFVDLFLNGNLIARDAFGTTPILLNGTNGKDTLQVDFSGGNPIPAGGITFNGNGPATSPGDAISFTSGTFTQITNTFINGSDGKIDFAGFGVVNYKAIEEPVLLAVTSVNGLTFNLPAGPSNAVLEEDAGGTGNNTAQIRSTGATFLPTIFTGLAANGLLIFNRGNAADTMTINKLVDVTSTIGVGDNGQPLANITQAGSVNSSGSVTYTAQTIAINAPLSTAFIVGLAANTSATQSAPITTSNLFLGLTGNTGDYTLTNPGNKSPSLFAVTTGKVAYTNSTGVEVSGTIGGTFDLITNGAVTQLGPLVVTGRTTITAGAANDITLDNANNDFSAIAIVSGKNVTLVDKNAIVIAGATVSGNFTVTSSGAMTQTATITVAGTTTLAAGAANSITLNLPTNDFNTVAIVSGNAVSLVDVNAMTLLSANVGSLAVTVATDLLVTGSVVAINTIALNAGQNVTANAGATLQAAGTIAIQFGANNAGAVADLRNAVILATNTTVNGGTGNDTFRVTGYTTPVTLDGKAPTATVTGDTLEFFAEGKNVTATPNSFSTAGAAVTYLDMETVRLLNPAAITLSGTNGNDVLTVRRTASGPLEYQFTGLVKVEAIGATSFRFNGLDGSDTLIVSYANGSPVPPGGIVFDGGNGTDNLCILGAGNVANYTTAAGSGVAGVVNVDNQPITFLNLETTSQVDITGMATVNIGFVTTDDSLDITTGFDVTAGGKNPALILSGPTTTKVGLWANTNVILDTSSKEGNDTITVTKADNNHLNTNLTIRTGTGTDLVAVTGPVAVTGDLLIDTQSASIAAVAVKAGGAITVQNAKTLTIGAATITAGGGFLQGNTGPVVFSGGIATVAASSIRFTGSLNGPGGLTANSAGDTIFEQTIGQTTPLSSLVTDASGTTRINGGYVRTSGVQKYNDVVLFSNKNTQFLATGGSITFNNTVDPIEAGSNLVVGGPNTDVTFTRALPSQDVNAINAFTIVDGRNVTFAARVKAVTVQQLVGSGQTTFNGQVDASGGSAVTNYTVGGAINLKTNNVVFAANVTAPSAPIVLQLANGVTQPVDKTSLTTTKLYLTGAGVFQLDQSGNTLTDGTAELFADLTGGEVRVRDKSALFIRFEDPTRTAIAVGNNGKVTLTTGADFTADDPRATSKANVDPATLKNLFNVGTGTVQVFVGVDRSANQSTAIYFVAEAKASQVTLGRAGPNTPADLLDNVSKDTFTVRPLLGAVLVVNGNGPVVTDGQAFAPFDSLNPQFVGITNTNFTAQGVGNGTYSFPGTAFQNLIFTSIEGLGGLRAEAFAVQTGPRVGANDTNSFAVRVQFSQQSVGTGNAVAINSKLLGNGIITNPFVVTPVTANSTTPYGAPHVTLANVDGDGIPDLIIANGAGDTPIVTIVRGSRLTGNADPLDLSRLLPSDIIAQFFPFEVGFRGGINVSTGDFDNDGRAEIVVSAGVGGGPRVSVYRIDPAISDPYSNAVPYRPELFNFFPFESSLRTGVIVAVGDVNGDGVPDIVVGAGVGGGPRVRVYDGKTGATIRDFFAYDSNFRGGVFVDVGRYDGDTFADLLTAPGTGGGPHIQVFKGSDQPAQLFNQPFVGFFAFDPPSGLVDNQSGDNGFNTGVSGVAFGGSQDGTGARRSILVSAPRGSAFSIVAFDPRLDLLNPTKFDTQYQRTLAGQLVNGVIVPTTSIEGFDFDKLRDGGSVGGFSADSK